MPNLCDCGCGNEVSEGKHYLRGHHKRVPIVKSEPEPEALENLKEELKKPGPVKVHIYPSFGEEDKGDGGVRRVVEAQLKYLPRYDIEIVPTAEEADIIACHITVPPPYLKLYPNKPIIGMCHGLYWSEYEWENWAYKANADVMELIRIADVVVAPSEWVANSIRRHTSRPVEVIPHGISPDDWEPGETMPYVLWNKTRPDPVCDPAPVNQLAKLMPEMNFVSTFGDEGLSNLHLTGKLSYEDAKDLVRRAGVYLCTSRETFGIGTLEAMACGVPVVGYEWGAQAEFIEQGKEGFLVKPGDIQELAKAIMWAFDNRSLASYHARKKALSFNWGVAARLYASLFKRVYENKVATVKSVKTSIIVTNYNLHEYLNDCLASVKNQTDPDWECIIVDDASPEPFGTEIADMYVKNDSRFRLIVNEKNQYLAEARNIGIREARGKYILPLDADDMLDSSAVELLSKYLDADKTTHIAYGNVLFLESDGKTPISYNPKFSAGHSGWPMEYSYELHMLGRNLLPYASMYRKEVWQNIGGYRRRQRTAEDAEFWARAASYGFRPKFVTQQDILIYRVREDSMSAIQPQTDWLQWFPWASRPEILPPSGAVTKDQLPVSSLEPLLISVVIPVGQGHEKLVQDAIDSVGAQTFSNWECIVVNDTGMKLPELPSWVRIIDTEGQTGPAHARNVGIAASRGRLFLPLDADDFLEPFALQVMFQAYYEHKDIIYSDFWDTDATGQIIGVHECDDYDPQLIAGKKRIFKGEVREGMIHAVTALTPKSVWEAVGGYDELLPAWEDWDFALCAADKGYCSRRVGIPLFTYRKNTGLRREQNFVNFEESKRGILSKWKKIWEGGYELMACRTCGAKKATSYPFTSVSMNGVQPQRISNQEGATLIRYTGTKAGKLSYRGTSGATYSFSATEPLKYVLNQDVQMFLRYPDFKIETSVQQEENLDKPALVAEGPPVK